MIRNSRFLV